MSKKITIDLNSFHGLVEAYIKLSLLEDAGVDNWRWYGDALSDEYVREAYPHITEGHIENLLGVVIEWHLKQAEETTGVSA